MVVDELHRRLAANIRGIAQERQIALTHLPDRAGVTRSHFWAVLRGEKSPTLRWLERLAKALNVDAAELLARRRRTS